jgi:hypothetical protein
LLKLGIFKPSKPLSECVGGFIKTKQMEELIKTLNNLRPTKEQVKDKGAMYAFGYVDALNGAIESIKEYVSLHGEIKDESVKTYDLVKGDYVKNIGSKNKNVTIGKEYLVVKVHHYHRDCLNPTMKNYKLTFAWILDDFGKHSKIVNSHSLLWQKIY